MTGLSASDAPSSGRKEPLLSLSEGATHPPVTLKFPDGELDTWVCLGHITNQLSMTLLMQWISPSPRLAAEVPLPFTLLGTAGRVFSHHHPTNQQPFPLPLAVVTSLSKQH